ncbi:MAG: insulinase family protein [Phycisphaerales bacterium]|nr:insulinase family protein [Phycisphaerales bacterium]
MKSVLTILLGLCALTQGAVAQVEPDVFTLDNGMKFIVLAKQDEPNMVAVGWVAKVGSVNERPGITGISHFFEHLMFKGTDTIGTSDAETDAEFTNREREIRNQMLDLIWNGQYERFKLGEIDDPWNPRNDTPQIASLRKELYSTMKEHRDVIVKDEFDSVYQGQGAVGMNAFTSEDVTFYINQLPSNKFELWCWMESDRLANSVFREFFSERDVVHEERRMRIESTPTGEFQEQFNSMFWQASPYSWPVIGWTSDLNSYTLEEALRYYDVYYQPSNLVGVVVGDVDPSIVKTMVTEYFGRLKEGDQAIPPVVTIEPSQIAPQRMIAEVDAQSSVEVRYHGVPFMHKDFYALEVMSGVLNGKTGRLYKTLVEQDEIASSALFRVDGKKYAGALSFTATVKGDAIPEQLENAWYEQVAQLQSEPVSAYELEKVKNNIVASQVRQLKSNFFLMIQLGYAEAIGGWEEINNAKDKLLAITTDDIIEVANRYLQLNNSSVAIYNRAEGVEPVDDELAAFSPEEQMMIKQSLKGLESIPDADLPQVYEQMKGDAAQVPPDFKHVFDYLLKKLEERMAMPLDEPEDVVEVEEDGEEVIEETQTVNVPEAIESQGLNAQQQAQADLMLANLADKPIGELKMVRGALSMASPNVSDEERPILEYVLEHLDAHINEKEGGE